MTIGNRHSEGYSISVCVGFVCRVGGIIETKKKKNNNNNNKRET